MLAVSGVAHFLAPKLYARIVPRWVPDPEAAVLWSGVVELALAVGLLIPRTRRASAWGAIALFVAVYPANIKHALDADAGTAEWWLTRARLPFQLLLIWWAYTFARPQERRDGNGASVGNPSGVAR